MSFVAQRVRDPLHNIIDFGADEIGNALWKVIQTRPFQRLRRIKQLGFSELVYPGATHTRFAHSIGVLHTARQLLGRIRYLQGEQNYRDTRAKRALAAALLHDVGHGPFSHAFEDVGKKLNLKMARHETVSDLLIRNSEISEVLDKELGSGFSSDVARIISGSPSDIYCAVVSSQFDADRLDYMRRDRLMCGSQHGVIDYEWLISNLEVGELAVGVDEEVSGSKPTFVLGPKAIYAAESYLLGLFQLYPTIYFHKTTRGAEKIFSKLLLRVFELAQGGDFARTGLPGNHPLTIFATSPDDLNAAQTLDDAVFWGSLEFMARADDQAIASLARRLRDRDLYKAIEIFTDEVLEEARVSQDKDFLNKIEKRIDELLIPKGTTDEGPPTFLVDRSKRSIYRKADESKGPLNQIMIRTAEKKLRDVAEISPVISAIGEFDALRVYIDKSDQPKREAVLKAGEEAIAYARAH